MKHLLISFSILIATSFALIGCDSSAPNINTNRMANTVANTANTVANAAANAAKTVANSVSSATTPSPADFAEMAARGGLAEVEIGRLAATKAKDPEIKKFAQMMVSDHSKVNAELKTLASAKKWTLPTDMGSHKDTLDKLKAQSGDDFDAAYVEMMVDDHETDVSAFQKQADNSTDPELKAFAAKTLPTLKKHLESIKAIQAKMK